MKQHKLRVTNYAKKELKGLNYNGIGGLCAQETIYYDNTMQAMKYDLVVGDGGGTGIYDTNITIILNFTSRIERYFNVNDNSYLPVVVADDHDHDEDDEDMDESNIHDTKNEDSNWYDNNTTTTNTRRLLSSTTSSEVSSDLIFKNLLFLLKDSLSLSTSTESYNFNFLNFEIYIPGVNNESIFVNIGSITISITSDDLDDGRNDIDDQFAPDSLVTSDSDTRAISTNGDNDASAASEASGSDYTYNSEVIITIISDNNNSSDIYNLSRNVTTIFETVNIGNFNETKQSCVWYNDTIVNQKQEFEKKFINHHERWLKQQKMNGKRTHYKKKTITID